MPILVDFEQKVRGSTKSIFCSKSAYDIFWPLIFETGRELMKLRKFFFWTSLLDTWNFLQLINSLITLIVSYWVLLLEKTIDSFTSIMIEISVHFFGFLHPPIKIIYPSSHPWNKSLCFFKSEYFFWEDENTKLQRSKRPAGKWNKLVNSFDDMGYHWCCVLLETFIHSHQRLVSALRSRYSSLNLSKNCLGERRTVSVV